jgi:short-subunit dehydrogenase
MIGAAYRYFVRRGGGHIAAITSIAGTKGLGPAPSYSATKAMQNVYLQALEQLANNQHRHICFTDIRPGFVDTDLLNGEFRYPMMLKTEKVAKEIVRAINRKEHVRVIDWRYRLLTAMWRCVPRFVWRRITLVK